MLIVLNVWRTQSHSALLLIPALWTGNVDDHDFLVQEELQRKSQLSCGYWWTGMAWGDWWKCFPQYRWPKFRTQRQGISIIGRTYCKLFTHWFLMLWLWWATLKARDGNVNKHIYPSTLLFSALFQNTFVGLTNLGATCYVNTFLQVWFHNLELRRSLYQCHNSRAQEHNIESGIINLLWLKQFRFNPQIRCDPDIDLFTYSDLIKTFQNFYTVTIVNPV